MDFNPAVITTDETPAVGAVADNRLPRPLSEIEVEAAFHRHVSKNGTYAHYCRHVTCECANGIVTLRGRVPTVQLKQVLRLFVQLHCGDMDISDQVNVISSTGMSEVCSSQSCSANGKPSESTVT